MNGWTTPQLKVWPWLSPDDFRAASEVPPFPLADGCLILSRGRYALRLGLQELGLQSGDAILMPAYHCGIELEVLVELGVAPFFYDVGDRLEPDEAELEALTVHKPRALFITHYFGFPQRSEYWRRWCDERGMLLIEDCAQSWLAHEKGIPVGTLGDLSLFSFYKTLGTSDGGGLRLRSKRHSAVRPGALGLTGLARRHMAWVATRSTVAHILLSRFQRGSQDEFQLEPTPQPITRLSLFALRRTRGETIAQRRRANYEYLLDKLGSLVPSAFRVLREGACPLVFPIGVGDDADLPRRIERGGIEAARFWEHHHPSFDMTAHRGAACRHAQLVGLPVHQHLRQGDLDRVIDAVQRAVGT